MNQNMQNDYALLLIRSYRQLTGHVLLPLANPAEAATALFNAPFVVLSHNTLSDPVFVYANRAAQQRFAMTEDQIIGLPSRYSAEPLARSERQRLLDIVARQGYIDDYCGVRIDRMGNRFEVRNATVRNVIDEEGRLHGQAATFSEWIDIAA
ncbi:MAG: MEKHLA domain-containing protein [Zoogloeaceae bacterium]|nr:MEKHLA domain-containing protein [Zoogloeaceae bacterium]